MTETELLTAITTGTKDHPGLCKTLGIFWFHVHDSRRSPAGFPDLVLVGGSRIIYRELKSEIGKLSPQQRVWGSILRNAGADWGSWRPGDLRRGDIQRELEGIR